MSDTLIQPAAADELERLQKSLAGPDWLRQIRTKALARYVAVDWPAIREEEWRRTNLSAFEFDSYARLEPSSRASADGSVASGLPDGMAGIVRVQNGVVSSAEIAEMHSALGVRFLPLSELLAQVTEASASRVQRVLERSFEEADNRLQYWHLAVLDEPIILYVPRNVAVDDPFFVEFSYSGDEEYGVPHLAVILEEGARAQIVKHLTAGDEGEMLINDAEDIEVADGANLHLVCLQQLNDESLYFANGTCHSGRDSQIHRTEAILGADFAKCRFSCSLDGDGANAVLNGLYFAVHEQHMDLRTVQRHKAPHTTSRAFYRGAARDESHTVYQGMIRVDGTARGTDAYLTNKNLILSADARADSIPSLNINTDDVKCSHGSTTGKLDPAQLFYLQTRGFDLSEASELLVQGYFEDIVSHCPDSVAAVMRELIAERISASDE